MYEALTKSKPNVDHFREFSYLTDMLVDSQLRKVQHQVIGMVFIGYCDNSKAYKVYDLNSKLVEITRDVRFFESKGWD